MKRNVIVTVTPLWDDSDFLEIVPMSFAEFLEAIGEGEKRTRLDERAWSTVNALHGSYCDLLKKYYFVGGMPEAVATIAADYLT